MPASPPCPSFALSPSACALLYAGSAWAETARVTFLLVNDIYLIADQMMPDGKRRGGFARLAAVVKAERAKAT
jgi:5'-nucleotidase / UDP-sugar diphosphatase